MADPFHKSRILNKIGGYILAPDIQRGVLHSVHADSKAQIRDLQRPICGLAKVDQGDGRWLP
jgi:hypothetical protein